MKSVVIFGIGKIAEVAFAHLKNDSPYDIVAFTVDEAYADRDEYMGLPVVPFERLEASYPPDRVDMFVAVGYQDLNRLRAGKVDEVRHRGYSLISYVGSRVCNFGKVPIGDNCLILDTAVLQPGASIGDNVFVWSGCHVGHHATVQDHCYLAGQVIVGGGSTIEPFCFLGINSTIGHEIVLGRESFVGAAASITKTASPKSVFIARDTEKFRLDSDSFLKIARLW